MALKRIAVTLGDPSGIGPEIALKASDDPRIRNSLSLVLFGDKRALDAHAKLCGLRADYRLLRSMADIASLDQGLALMDVPSLDESFRIGEVSAASGAATIAALDAAVDAAKAGVVDAVVGSPIHETAIKQAGIAFDGHPSYLARRTGTPVDEVGLMLCWERTRVAHVTLHLSVRDALTAITQDRVEKVIRTTAQALGRLGIARPRIGVSGVNPHAGESGLFGREEIEIIAPAIGKLRDDGMDLIGPIGADTLLPRKDCDAFVVMLHDQGHVAARVAAPNMAAAMSIGTPVVFSSVGHGTAMDIAGKGVANPEALVQALLHVSNTFPTGDGE
ncbi:hypothetical protein CDO46_15055 [Pigmentiphaga sp. NML030171]|jgi:4-hydroxythreonine-4-phosphate dehydrogenase|uniref:4-hydroxythreonine-4-phosphate dehydrogenase PdxA n=1 Tax=Pigmentiphaga daeguensis TaxID=414049 RepID=A0ABN1BJ16_9BURK|nr:hypothetical protein CDO46_15055 [Pigmentiphaga sp. NML030171]